MKKFFAPNIDRVGRTIRAVMGVAMVAAAAYLSKEHPWLALASLAYGAFALFEAARGWCIVRACGIKTKY